MKFLYNFVCLDTLDSNQHINGYGRTWQIT